ncbi:hypothetical protein ABZP36_008846 [Zizania latifolia]
MAMSLLVLGLSFPQALPNDRRRAQDGTCEETRLAVGKAPARFPAGEGILVVEVKGVRVVTLIGLGVLDDNHKRVGDRHLDKVGRGEGDRGEHVEGDDEAEVEGLELDMRGVGGTTARRGDDGIESDDGMGREALPCGRH